MIWMNEGRLWKMERHHETPRWLYMSGKGSIHFGWKSLALRLPKSGGGIFQLWQRLAEFRNASLVPT